MHASYFLVQDRYADARAIPPIDEQQDYELTGFQESGGKTVLKFKRKFDTCDPRDRKLEVSNNMPKTEMESNKIIYIIGWPNSGAPKSHIEIGCQFY